MTSPPILPRRPSAKSFPVQDLLLQIREGLLAVPDFQRPLKWRQQEGALLFDSLVRGYPVGTLLLWKRPRNASPLALRALLPGLRLGDDPLVVIDGQQRLSALARVLLRETPHEHRWDLSWALSEERVRATSARGRGLSVPLGELGDSADLSEWVAEQGIRGGDARQVFELGRAVREYTVPAYVLEADDETAVRRIFQRANTSGRRLTADEVFTGLHGGGAGDTIGTLQALGGALADTGFGHLSSKWLHQATLAIAGIDATKATSISSPQENAEAPVPARSIAATEAPLRHTIRFLIEDADILHAGLLPYGIVLPVLGAFFSRHPTPVPRNRELLRRWIYRGAISGLHRGDRIPYRRAMLSAARLEDESDAVQALVGLVPRKLSSMPTIPPRFVHRDALVRLFLLGLANLGPRDLLTGDAVDLTELAESVSRLPKLTASSSSPSDSVASRFWLPPRRGGITAEELARATPEILASHGFDERGQESLARGDVPSALLHRRNFLEARTTQFLLERCRFGEPDRRPLAHEAAS